MEKDTSHSKNLFFVFSASCFRANRKTGIPPPAFHTCASYFVSLELKLIIIEAASARVVLPPGRRVLSS